MNIKFLNESVQIGTDSKKLKAVLSKYFSSEVATFYSISFESNKNLSDGSPSVFAVLHLKDGLAFIEAYSFETDFSQYNANSTKDCYIAVYVRQVDKLIRFLETGKDIFPKKAKSILLSLTKCKTLKDLLNRGLSLKLNTSFEFNRYFSDLIKG